MKTLNKTFISLSMLIASTAGATNTYVADLQYLGKTTLELIDANTDSSQYLLNIQVDDVVSLGDGGTKFVNIRSESPRAYVHLERADELCKILGYRTGGAGMRKIGFIERNIRTPYMILLDDGKVRVGSDIELLAMDNLTCYR